MDLIVSERIRTNIAHRQGEEFSELDPLETSLEDLRSWLSQKQGTTQKVREDEDGIVVDSINHVGIVMSQLTIDCNASDRARLIEELASGL